jgi:hypothetical protein
MRERFLNILLFLFSLAFIAAGVILMFFQDLHILAFVKGKMLEMFVDQKFALFFMAFFGSFIFAWGFFILLLTVFSVMEMKVSSIYGFIFWGFTFWAGSASIVAYLNKYIFLDIAIGAIYGVLLVPFLITLPFKSGNGKRPPDMPGA